MKFLRLLLSAAAAVSLCACGASSVSDTGNMDPKFEAAAVKAAPQAAAPQQRPQPQQEAAQREATLQKVSLSLKAMGDPDSKAYKIGPHDVLEITVFKVPELSKVLQVSEAGTINYPLIGDVEAAGKSARELEASLSKDLGKKYLQNPQISVSLKDHNSQRVTIDGAVVKPGIFPISGGLTLWQAIAQCGGFTPVASETVLLFRQVDGKQTATKYDVSDIRAGRAKDANLQAGDMIVAPTSDVQVGLNYFFRFLPLASVAPLL